MFLKFGPIVNNICVVIVSVEITASRCQVFYELLGEGVPTPSGILGELEYCWYIIKSINSILAYRTYSRSLCIN